MRKKKKGNYSLDVMMPSYFLSVLWSMASGLTPAVPNPSRTFLRTTYSGRTFTERCRTNMFRCSPTSTPTKRPCRCGGISKAAKTCAYASCPTGSLTRTSSAWPTTSNDGLRHPVEPLSSTLPLLDRPARLRAACRRFSRAP